MYGIPEVSITTQDIITRNDKGFLQAAPLPYKDVALVDPSDGYGVIGVVLALH